MFKCDRRIPLLLLLLEGVSLSLFANDNYDYHYRNTSQNVRPGISADDDSPYYHRPATGREEVAYMDERDQDIHRRANRRGDWGYRQNWRYDREAFYRGETQGEAYDREHPDSAGGIGMDPDNEYLQMRRFYLEEEKRNRQNAANRASKNTPQGNRSQRNNHNAYQKNYSNTSSYTNQGNLSRDSYPNRNPYSRSPSGNYESQHNPSYSYPSYDSHY